MMTRGDVPFRVLRHRTLLFVCFCFVDIERGQGGGMRREVRDREGWRDWRERARGAGDILPLTNSFQSSSVQPKVCIQMLRGSFALVLSFSTTGATAVARTAAPLPGRHGSGRAACRSGSGPAAAASEEVAHG
jgi:hypothetical protein